MKLDCKTALQKTKIGSKAVVLLLLLLTCCLLLLPLRESVIVLCFVVRYLMSPLVLQFSWWGRELVALLSLSSWCLVVVVWLFLTVPWVCLQFVIVVFPDHTDLLFFKTNYRLMQVKSIAECSKGSILQYFWPSLIYHLTLRSLFSVFRVVVLHRFYCISCKPVWTHCSSI